MRLILLPGAGKTGSTYLQKVFEKNKRALKKIGVAYPLPLPPSDAGNAEFIWYWMSQGNETNLIAEIRNSLCIAQENDASIVIFSCEMIIDLATSDHLKLREILSEYFSVIDCFVLLRNPVDWALSAWLQSIKRGNSSSFVEYCAKYGTSQLSCALRFSKVFPATYFLSYDAIKPNFLENFFRLIRLGSTGFAEQLDTTGISRNSSLTAREVKVSLIFNKFWTEQGEREGFQAFLSSLGSSTDSPPYVVSNSARSQVAAMNAELVKIFARDHEIILDNF
jgi:hypothetical protein